MKAKLGAGQITSYTFDRKSVGWLVEQYPELAAPDRAAGEEVWYTYAEGTLSPTLWRNKQFGKVLLMADKAGNVFHASGKPLSR